MRNVVVAAVQMKCSKVVEENINKAEELIRKAAKKGFWKSKEKVHKYARII